MRRSTMMAIRWRVGLVLLAWCLGSPSWAQPTATHEGAPEEQHAPTGDGSENTPSTENGGPHAFERRIGAVEAEGFDALSGLLQQARRAWSQAEQLQGSEPTRAGRARQIAEQALALAEAKARLMRARAQRAALIGQQQRLTRRIDGLRQDITRLQEQGAPAQATPETATPEATAPETIAPETPTPNP